MVRSQPPAKTKLRRFWTQSAGKWTRDRLRIKLQPSHRLPIKMSTINLPTVASWPEEWVITTISTNITITPPSLSNNKKHPRRNLKGSMCWPTFFLVRKRRKENWREEDPLSMKSWISNLAMMWTKKLNKLKKERKKSLMMSKVKKRKKKKMTTELLVRICLTSNLEKWALTSRSKRKKKRSWKTRQHKKQAAWKMKVPMKSSTKVWVFLKDWLITSFLPSLTPLPRKNSKSPLVKN